MTKAAPETTILEMEQPPSMVDARVATFALQCAMHLWAASDRTTPERSAQWEHDRQEVDRLYALWAAAAKKAADDAAVRGRRPSELADLRARELRSAPD